MLAEGTVEPLPAAEAAAEPDAVGLCSKDFKGGPLALGGEEMLPRREGREGSDAEAVEKEVGAEAGLPESKGVSDGNAAALLVVVLGREGAVVTEGDLDGKGVAVVVAVRKEVEGEAEVQSESMVLGVGKGEGLGQLGEAAAEGAAVEQLEVVAELKDDLKGVGEGV